MWDLSSRDSVLLPAIAGISSVLVVIAGLFWLQSSRLYKKAVATGGTHYEVNDDGTSVRRSNRERKSVARWSPDDLSSPTGMHTPEKGSPLVEEPLEKLAASGGKLKKSITATAEAALGTPPAKRGRGRPPKTPKAG